MTGNGQRFEINKYLVAARLWEVPYQLCCQQGAGETPPGPTADRDTIPYTPHRLLLYMHNVLSKVKTFCPLYLSPRDLQLLQYREKKFGDSKFSVKSIYNCNAAHTDVPCREIAQRSCF